MRLLSFKYCLTLVIHFLSTDVISVRLLVSDQHILVHVHAASYLASIFSLDIDDATTIPDFSVL